MCENSLSLSLRGEVKEVELKYPFLSTKSAVLCKLIFDYALLCIFNFSQVEKSSTSNLHRTPDISMLPASPSEPKLVNVTSTSVTLEWKRAQQKQGGSSFFGYTVEYFSSDLQTGWVTAAQRVPNNVVTVSAPNARLFSHSAS